MNSSKSAKALSKCSHSGTYVQCYILHSITASRCTSAGVLLLCLRSLAIQQSRKQPLQARLDVLCSTRQRVGFSVSGQPHQARTRVHSQLAICFHGSLQYCGVLCLHGQQQGLSYRHSQRESVKASASRKQYKRHPSSDRSSDRRGGFMAYFSAAEHRLPTLVQRVLTPFSMSSASLPCACGVCPGPCSA